MVQGDQVETVEAELELMETQLEQMEPQTPEAVEADLVAMDHQEILELLVAQVS